MFVYLFLLTITDYCISWIQLSFRSEDDSVNEYDTCDTQSEEEGKFESSDAWQSVIK